MKGGKTKTELLKLLSEPKNKLQLPYDPDINWKAVDAHIDKLLYYGLVSEVARVGMCKMYAITEKKGKSALALADKYHSLIERQ